MSTITIQAAELFDWQLEVYMSYKNNDYKTYVVNCSRQIGKSLLLSQLILDSAINNDRVDVGVISLTYKQVRLIYSNISDLLKKTPILKNDNKSDLTIELVNGSKIRFLTVQNPDNIRGYTFDYLFCDEFAFYGPETWQKVLMPTTLAKGKKVVLASTPRGTSNAFYDLFMEGMNPQNKTITSFMYDYTWGPFGDDEIDAIRRQLPAHIFNAEFLCQFTENGAVFNDVHNISTIDKWGNYDSNESYYAGCDIALFTDFAVCTILNSKGDVVDVYREKTGSINKLNTELEFFLRKWQPKKTVIELNNQGVTVYEHLQPRIRGIEGFKTTAVSKPDLIHDLQRAIEEKTIHIPNNKLFPAMADELINFSFSFSEKTKQILYAALPGKHDDCVISLALANKLYQQYHGTHNIKKKVAFRIG